MKYFVLASLALFLSSPLNLKLHGDEAAAKPVNISGAWIGVCDQGVKDFIRFEMKDCQGSFCNKIVKTYINEDGTNRNPNETPFNVWIPSVYGPQEYFVGVEENKSTKDYWKKGRGLSTYSCTKLSGLWTYSSDLQKLIFVSESTYSEDINACKEGSYRIQSAVRFDHSKGTSTYYFENSPDVLILRNKYKSRSNTYPKEIESESICIYSRLKED